MDIMELGAIGELVGGVAVIATLIYLALQVKHSARIAESSAYTETAESWKNVLQPVIDEMDLFIRGVENYRDLDEGDSLKFSMLLANILVYHETFYLKHERTGLVGREEMDRMKRITTWYLMRPGIRRGFWSDYRFLFTETFARHVDAIVQSITEGEGGDLGSGDSGLRADT